MFLTYCTIFISQDISFHLLETYHRCFLLIHPLTIHTLHFFLPVIQFSTVSIFPPLFHTHSTIYLPSCIVFFCQHFSLHLSVLFNNCSTLIQQSTKHAVQFFLPGLQVTPISIILPLFHTLSTIDHPCWIEFSPNASVFPSQYYSNIAHIHSFI